MNAMDALTDHVLGTSFADLPRTAVDSAKTFILDSIGVGISGSRHPLTCKVKQAVAAWGDAHHARVLATGEWLPAPSAVMVNAYQVHNQEFDCLHDRAVVHTLATVMTSLLAYAERGGGASGEDMLLALVLGVDVAAFIGMTPRGPMRFFRPALCGALGATAALAKIGDFDRETFRNAMGIMYSHLSGTMQAHTEGLPTVALQVGLNGRAAISAFDLARTGFSGPRDILDGPYGYFSLFDTDPDWESAGAELGEVFQITRMSHKPYPTGRACHAGIDGVQMLQARYNFSADDVAHVRVIAPPLISRLVGRQAHENMNVGYAKLCMGYDVATALLTGDVGIRDFDAEALADPRRIALGRRVEVVSNRNADANALGPQSVEVALHSGATHTIDLPALLGHPDNPLSRERQMKKFDACWRSAGVAFDPRQIEQLIEALDNFDALSDVRRVVDLSIAGSTP